MDDFRRYTQQNRRAWNEIARVRHQNKFPPAAFFAQGGSTLDERVLQAAGEVRGKRLLHLQCSTGFDTLSWAVAGASVTGVDISEAQIEIAHRAAQEAGLPAHFIAADVYDLPTELCQGDFELVFTGGGAIVWLPELGGWARAIAGALRAGGLFLLHEIHPLAACFWMENGVLTVPSDYFGRTRPEVGQGWSHFRGGEGAVEPKYEFSWPLGDIVTALAQAGLVIQTLREFPVQEEWIRAYLGDYAQRLPGEFLLAAVKTGVHDSIKTRL